MSSILESFRRRASDAGQPRGKTGAALELVQVLVGLDVSILGDVLGLSIVAQDGARSAI
jgi:hypothetical protein